MLSSFQMLSSICTAAMSATPRASSICPTVTLQADRLDEPVALKRRERANAGRQRRAGVEHVQLIEIDPVDAERATAGVRAAVR